MEIRHRGIAALIAVILALATLSSCISYGYTLVTYNETTARIREHEILGTVSLEVHATAEMWDSDIGLRALLLEAAKEEFGEDVDDVVNLAVSESTVYGSYYATYLLVQGSAIRYNGGES